MVFASHGEEWPLAKCASTGGLPARSTDERELRMRTNRISARSWLLALYIVTIIVVAVGKAYGHRGPDNNFLIFRWSFLNLAAGNDMLPAARFRNDQRKIRKLLSGPRCPYALPTATTMMVTM